MKTRITNVPEGKQTVRVLEYNFGPHELAAIFELRCDICGNIAPCFSVKTSRAISPSICEPCLTDGFDQWYGRKAKKEK